VPTPATPDGAAPPEGWWSKGAESGGCFPESKKEARRHIEWIRTHKQADSPGSNTKTLHAYLRG
jgi:hypothetical protein